MTPLQKLRTITLLFALSGVVGCTAPSAMDAVSTTDGSRARPAPATGGEIEAALLVKADASANWLISPVSIEQAFGLAQLGATGATADQISAVVGIEQGQAGAAAMAERRAMLTDAGPGVTIAIENALWLAQGWSFRPAFVAGAQRHYGAAVQTLDFRGNPSASAAAINAWAASKTRGLIGDFVQPSSINPDTAAFLTNATYFRARWATSFAQVERGQFRAGNAAPIDLDMVRDRRRVRYRETPHYQAARIRYGDSEADSGGERFAMEVYLPRPGVSLDAMRVAILGTGLETTSQELNAARETTVDLALPEFEISFTTDLRKAMEAIGLTLPFDRARAEFGGMTATPVYIDQAVHTTRLRVDREGTEAAAVTSLVPMPVSAPPPFNGPVMHVDRPFLLVIRDARTGSWLFTGMIVRPTPLKGR